MSVETGAAADTTQGGTTSGTAATGATGTGDSTLLTATTPAAGTADPAKVEGQQESEGATQEAEFALDLTMPEGIELDQSMADEFTTFAKAEKLTTKQGNEIVKLYTAAKQREIEAHVQRVGEWGEASRNDKEIGGAEFDVNLGSARAALEQFGTPELKQLLIDTGFGNHPEIVRTMVRIGKAMAEDKFVRGRASQGGPQSEQEIALQMYPSMRKQA